MVLVIARWEADSSRRGTVKRGEGRGVPIWARRMALRTDKVDAVRAMREIHNEFEVKGNQKSFRDGLFICFILSYIFFIFFTLGNYLLRR